MPPALDLGAPTPMLLELGLSEAASLAAAEVGLLQTKQRSDSTQLTVESVVSNTDSDEEGRIPAAIDLLLSEPKEKSKIASRRLAKAQRKAGLKPVFSIEDFLMGKKRCKLSEEDGTTMGESFDPTDGQDPTVCL